MAEKPVVNSLGNLQNETSAVAIINANFQRLADAFIDLLDNSDNSENTMNVPLDMNDQRIINLPRPTLPTDPIRLVDRDILKGPKGDTGSQGPQGDAGPPGIGIQDSGVTSSVVGGHKAIVSIDGLLSYGSADTLSHYGKVVGISITAGVANSTIQYGSFGPLADPSFSFTAGPVYLGFGGLLTQTVPTSAGGYIFSQQIGVATTANKLIINVQQPILLATS